MRRTGEQRPTRPPLVIPTTANPHTPRAKPATAPTKTAYFHPTGILATCEAGKVFSTLTENQAYTLLIFS